MIITLIFGMIYLLIGGLLTAVLPTSAPPDLGLTGLVEQYAWLNAWLPVAETVEMFVLGLEVLAIVGTVYGTVWVLQKIPFLGVH